MTKDDIQTGMTAIDMRNMEWMFYLCPLGSLHRIPIQTEFKRDEAGNIIDKIRALIPKVSFNTDSMGDDLIETDADEFPVSKYYEIYSPYQIKRIYHSKCPTGIFDFKDEDIVWKLNKNIQ